MKRWHMIFAAMLGLLVLAFLPISAPPVLVSSPPRLVRVVSGLDHPWGMVFLPDGSLLVTERSGKLRRVILTDNIISQPLQGLPQIDTGGQAGLLGVAIDPEFSANRRVYLSFAQALDGGNVTAVFRGRLADDFSRLEDGKVIFRQNLAAASDKHFGSRLVFDRGGNLFVTTGDRASLSMEAQNPASHVGKVLRITREGGAAPGNPELEGWAPETWSMGHRNVQGATLHPETGRLWTAEHGAMGGDEINAPEAGKNYGWPVITYGRDYSGEKIGEGTSKPGLEQPLHYWDPSIAPSGLVFLTSDVYPLWKGNLFVGALAGQHLHRLKLDGEKIIGGEKLFEGFGRIRDVVQGPDGHLFVLTDADAPDGGLYMVSASGEVATTVGN